MRIFSKLLFTGFLLSSLCPTLFSQELQVKKLSAYKEIASFPFYEGHSHIADRINMYLQMQVLENVDLTGSNKVLRKYDPKDKPEDDINPNIGISFQVNRNDKYISMVSIYCDYMGPYISSWVETYMFNVQNGDYIELEDLFTESGYLQISAKAHQAFNDSVTAKLNEIRTSLDTTIEDNMWLIETMQACYFGDYAFSGDYWIENNTITFTGGECMPHVAMYYDPNTTFSFTITENEKDWLSDFGKAVFLGLDVPAVDIHGPTDSQLFECIADDGTRFFLLGNGLSMENYMSAYAYFPDIKLAKDFSKNLVKDAFFLRCYDKDYKENGRMLVNFKDGLPYGLCKFKWNGDKEMNFTGVLYK